MAMPYDGVGSKCMVHGRSPLRPYESNTHYLPL